MEPAASAAALEFALAAHGIGAIVEVLVVDQVPRPPTTGPARLVVLVLEHAPLEV